MLSALRLCVWLFCMYQYIRPDLSEQRKYEARRKFGDKLSRSGVICGSPPCGLSFAALLRGSPFPVCTSGRITGSFQALYRGAPWSVSCSHIRGIVPILPYPKSLRPFYLLKSYISILQNLLVYQSAMDTKGIQTRFSPSSF